MVEPKVSSNFVFLVQAFIEAPDTIYAPQNIDNPTNFDGIWISVP